MPRKVRDFQFVEVVWLDANADNSWRDLGDEVELAQCISRGWLIKETDKYIIIAGTVGLLENGDVQDSNLAIAIPRGMIESVAPFPTKRKRKAIPAQ